MTRRLTTSYRPWILHLFAWILFILVFFLSLTWGSVSITWSEIISAIRHWLSQEPLASSHESIILYLRLPRVLLAGLIGMALSLSGAVMQGLLRNPLADGGTLGVSSAAALGAVCTIAFGWQVPQLPLTSTVTIASVFAFITMLGLLSFTYWLDAHLNPSTIILLGIIISMFSNSAISLILAFAKDQVQSILFWTLGSFSGASYSSVGLIFLALVLGGGIILSYSQELNALALDEVQAHMLGVPVQRVRLHLLIAVAFLIGLSVALGGSIAFVGLIVPHLTRLLIGPNHRNLLPLSMCLGGSFVMVSDLLARTLLSPIEIPIGIITSLIGSMTVVFLILRQRKER